MPTLKASLLAALESINGVESRPSAVAGGSALFYHGKEFAHFYNNNELDIRLSKKVIQSLKMNHPADSQHHPNRSPNSPWIEVRYDSIDELNYVVVLVKLAVAQL